jgi:hypothetical protein
LATVNGAFQIEVADDVPDGHVVDFELTAVGQDTWVSYFSIEALAPTLNYVEFLVDDTAAGNGDYMWDPGETVSIVVTLENIGSSDAFNVEGLLSTTDPYITLITTTAQSYGDITYGNNADAVFTASSSLTTPEAHMAGFTIDFTADLGVSGNGTFATQIGGYLIEEYFGTFPPAGWTTTGGSNWGSGSGSNAGGTPPEADFWYDPSTVATQRLISMPINTSGSATLSLSFRHMVDNYNGGYTLKVQTTSDGNTWNDVWSITPAGNVGPELLQMDVTTPDVGSSNFQIAWVFDGNSWNIDHWYVDNIVLGGGTPATFGTVEGVVTDFETTLPLEGADIAGFTVSGADGSYSFTIVPGTYDFTCILEGYEDLTQTGIVVVENEITTLDFAMVPILPLNSPQNVEAAVIDFNDVLITWNAPATDLINTNEVERDTRIKTRQNQRNSVPNADNSRSLTGYQVYRDGTMISEITDPGILIYTDAALAAGGYDYYVIAVYDEGYSDPSNTASVTIVLPAPTNLAAVQQFPDVILTWDVPVRDLASYNVYRDNVMIADNISTTSYTDTNVPAGTYIYQVTAVYDGGYESDFSNEAEITVVDVTNNLIPLITELQGNHPNPFNPITSINFALSDPEFVNLEIYNIKGEKVKTLVDEKMEAQFHSVTWNGSDDSGKPVSSGVYFYKMKAGKFIQTKKMILMK